MNTFLTVPSMLHNNCLCSDVHCATLTLSLPPINSTKCRGPLPYPHTNTTSSSPSQFSPSFSYSPGASATSWRQALPSARSSVPSSSTTTMGSGSRVVVVVEEEVVAVVAVGGLRSEVSTDISMSAGASFCSLVFARFVGREEASLDGTGG